MFSDKLKNKVTFFILSHSLCFVEDIIDLYSFFNLREFIFDLMIINRFFMHIDTHIERNFDTT